MRRPLANRRPDEPALSIVDVDDRLSYHHAAAGRHDARTGLETGIEDEAGMRRVCSAPMSRMASQTGSGCALVTISVLVQAVFALPLLMNSLRRGCRNRAPRHLAKLLPSPSQVHSEIDVLRRRSGHFPEAHLFASASRSADVEAPI